MSLGWKIFIFHEPTLERKIYDRACVVLRKCLTIGTEMVHRSNTTRPTIISRYKRVRIKCRFL